ncbi:MAG: hypothetical protein KDD47_22195 [Acidobacteria bacterium]|nr:hypothetical protein [Acidobacteriota bacterium]
MEEILEEAIETGHLPLEFAGEVAPRLRLQLHQRKDYLPAHFAPLPLRPLEEDPNAEVLPQVPTLYLHRSTYSENGRLRAFQELTVDSAEGLFNALLLAYFELEVLASDSDLNQELEAAARERLPGVDPRYRVPALVQGLADFGSHLLSVANQLNRLEARGKARGKDLCPLMNHSGTLFGLWEKIFRDGVYLARFYRPAGEGELSGGWRETSVAISREDKEILLRRVLRTTWTGNRQQDLGSRFCPAIEERKPDS